MSDALDWLAGDPALRPTIERAIAAPEQGSVLARFSDGEKLPASLSGRAVSVLRDKGSIGFHGVVVSDDLEMGAVRDDYSLEERVVKAVNAGTALLVFSNVE